MALLQAGGDFKLERTRSPGGAGDLYTDTTQALGPNTVPDTNTYQSMSHSVECMHTMFALIAV